MSMESKEKWIEKVIDSSTSLEPKTHQPFLYRKTMNRIEQGEENKTLSWWLKPALAGLCLLVFANSVMVYNYSSVDENEFSSSDEIALVTVSTEEDLNTILDEYALQEVEASLYNF